MVHLRYISDHSDFLFPKTQDHAEYIVQQVWALHPIVIQFMTLEHGRRIKNNTDGRTLLFWPYYCVVRYVMYRALVILQFVF